MIRVFLASSRDGYVKLSKENIKERFPEGIDYLNKVIHKPIHFRAGIKSNQYWLDCMEYVASGQLQKDFRQDRTGI